MQLKKTINFGLVKNTINIMVLLYKGISKLVDYLKCLTYLRVIYFIFIIYNQKLI